MDARTSYPSRYQVLANYECLATECERKRKRERQREQASERERKRERLRRERVCVLACV